MPPLCIADAAQGQARDFARRKHDHCLIALQRLVHGAQTVGRGLAAEDAQGNQQIGQAIEREQQIVREDLHIAPDLADAGQQREGVDATHRMIRDDDHATVFGNAFALDVIDQVTRIEQFERGLDEGQTAQMRGPAQEGIDLFEAREPRQRTHETARQRRAASGKPVRETGFESAFDIEHAAPLSDARARYDLAVSAW